jgi:hypothetical protein
MRRRTRRKKRKVECIVVVAAWGRGTPVSRLDQRHRASTRPQMKDRKTCNVMGA